MTRRALLIGAQTNGLTGVLNDVAAIARALDRRGFQIEQLTGPAASRGGILDAYQKLITDAQPDDAFVVYYSGHGGLWRPPEAAGNQPPARSAAALRPDLQFIVPDDYTDSTEDDFRGITGVELSVLLAKLTAVTPNATVVLDCCHAAHMSRDAALRVKSLLRESAAHPHLTYETVERHIAELVAGGLDPALRDITSSPHAVRLVACSPDEAAWEGANRDGVRMGLFTDALTRALEATEGLRVNWSTLIDMVRRQVQVFAQTQRPDAEGPATRMPFDTAPVELLATLTVASTDPGRVVLLGAPLLAVEKGDEFAIMPAGASGPGDGPVIGTATVDGLSATAALAALRPADGWSVIPADARAHRTRAAAPALPVRLPDTGAVAAQLRSALMSRPLIRPAEALDDSTVAVVVQPDGRLAVQDSVGPLHAPYPATPDGIEQVVGNLQRLAQATALRRLTADPATRLDHRVSVEWGRVTGTGTEPLPLTDALIHAHASERVYFRLRNDGDDAVYVSLIDVGVSSRIAVLTGADPSGRRLPGHASFTYGWNEDTGQLSGVPVTWPEQVDPTYARPETVLVLISEAPVDVSVLQQDGVRDGTGWPGPAAGRSPLARLLVQVATGATREVGPAPERTARYDVQPVDFMVTPTAQPTTEVPTFVVDDRPTQPVRLLAPRGTLPGRIAVRLDELVVHRNHALFGADIRVDALALTGGAGDQPVPSAKTMRFSNVHDDERLPLDGVLIYHGSAVDFLDLAIWVSRDRDGSLELGRLLEQGITTPAVQAAGAQVAELVLSAPHAAAAVAVLSAGAVVVNTAYRMLSGVVGPGIGLYRTSWLAQEQFGIGRHERQAQGCSFTLIVEAVS
jgi:hypothetical protein